MNEAGQATETPRERWVCLMFHDVLPATAAAGGGPERFATPLSSFELVLDVIREGGYAGCSLEVARRSAGPRVAITFDDGGHSQFEHAVPALRKRGMTATFFVTTDWVGRPGFVTWDELRQMAAWGMSIQSHTRSHPFLSELDEAALRAELTGSKAALDRELGQSTTELSLPGGDAPGRRLRRAFREAGYEVVAGSRWGVNRGRGQAAADRFVRRCTVRGDVTREAAARVIAGDPWLALRRHPREAVLASVRRALGPTRYARWRRGLLDAVEPA